LPLDGQLSAYGRGHIQRHRWRWGCEKHIHVKLEF
jgi:hypothetical protein